MAAVLTPIDQRSDDTELAGRRLRELSAGEFEARYGCDRFTATVLSNKAFA